MPPLWVSGSPRQDSGEHQSPAEVQGQGDRTDPEEQSAVDVSGHRGTQRVSTGMDSVFSDSAVQIPVQGPGCMDTKQAAVDPVEEMEEHTDIPEDHEGGRIPTARGEACLGHDEQMALGHADGSSFRSGHQMVQEARLGVPP